MDRKPRFGSSLLLVTVFLSLTLSSCFKDDLDLSKVSDRFEITPGFAIPVGYGSLTISDLLNRFDSANFVKEDSLTGLLMIVYDAQLLSYRASDIIEIPDQKFDQFFVRSEISLPEIIDSVVVKKSKNYGFTLNQDEEIDSLVMNSGILRYDISSSFLNTGILEISSPKMFKNKRPYFQQMQIGNTTGDFHDTIDYDLTNTSLQLTRSNDSTYVPLFFKLKLFNDGNPLRSGDSVLVDISFLDLDFHILYGNIGYKSFLNYQGEIQMNLFQNPLGGEIEFAEPSFDINIQNSFGVPIVVQLSNVSTESERTGQNVNITFPPDENPITIQYPSLEELGVTKETVVTFDNISPPINQVIKTEPGKLKFTADAYTDTSLQAPGNFIIDTSKFIADLNVNLPLWLRAGNFALEDTMDFDLKEMFDNPAIIDTLVVKLDVENGLPMDLGIQIMFTDENYNVLDILYDPSYLPQVRSGKLDAGFRVNQETGKTSWSTFGTLGPAKVKRIENAKYAIISASITTTDFNTDPDLKVKFYSDYKMDFKLAVKARLRVNEETTSGGK
ncbi:MAG: hypothetical protein U0T82_00240 [Bacteroidales bacterium]